MPRVNLKGMKIAFMMANEGVEQVELTEPWKAVQEAGGQPDLVAPQAGEVQAMNHLDKASRFSVDRTTAEVRPEDYVGLVLPGGVANPGPVEDRPISGAIRKSDVLDRQTGGSDLPRPLDSGRGRRGAWEHAHLLAQPEDRHHQRGGQVGRRSGAGSPRWAERLGHQA
jgi:hypothetical protein